MPLLQLNISEGDIIRLILEFLNRRDLHITQLSLERETGVINSNYPNDVLFLRQLILDGQWDDVLEFIQPLSPLKDFQGNKFHYIILRQKYIELLCIKSEIKEPDSILSIVNEVVDVLGEVEKFAPSKEEYSKLCLLLTLPSITNLEQYKNWNPSTARVQCFQEVYPLVENFMPSGKPTSNASLPKSAKNDRLMQLVIKGILYESCVNFCQSKATGVQEAQPAEVNFSQLLDVPGLGKSDLSLQAWLQSIPLEIFGIPFEHTSLSVDVEKLERPSLHTSWTEHMLVTPIKPRTFPHVKMVFRRPQSAADVMSRSLRPLTDRILRPPIAMAQSAIDAASAGYAGNALPVPLSNSYSGFHLTGMKDSRLMNTSVDKLFEVPKSELSRSYAINDKLQPIQENAKATSDTVSARNQANGIEVSNVSTPEQRPQDYSASTSAAADDELSVDFGAYKRDLLKEYEEQKHLRKLSGSQPGRVIQVGDVLPSRDFTNQRGQQQEAANLASGGAVGSSNRPGNDEPTVTGAATMGRNGGPTSATRASDSAPTPAAAEVNNSRPTFKPVTLLEDLQAVRCAEFHPNGNVYAVGSNTKTLRICTYPKMDDFKNDSGLAATTVLMKRTKHHKGSIYCMAWSPAGDLLATGSNDKTVKMMKFNSHTSYLEGQEMELTMHDGTIRDLCFIEDTTNKASLLVSGGAGDCKVYVTDCATGKTFQSLSGHTGHVLALYNWGGAMFVSGSQDKTVRFWDLRVGGCVNVITPPTGIPARVTVLQSTAVGSLTVDPSGRLLVCGHEDGSCALHDVRGSRTLHRFMPHGGDVRSVRFSPGAYYLLSAGYDGRVVLSDMQGDLTCPLPNVLVARHPDKVISARWHPEDFSFLSTSADKTAVLWTIPPI
ncbi:WD repeat-containing protein 47 isoform X2 [Bicyclus anynana]|uniref:WD repeat-containing protein 47 isoform X2 n=1 Tax=Bicyclus anynana TaxID=110368 RepID=A0A6J1N7S5_BICAN|nr:WD repeat-containing protein 47 isoform X2 [Bicyclus anynana]